VPILKKPMHKGEGSAHRWWNRKLADENESTQKKVNDCLKKNGEKPITHNKGEAGMKKTAKKLKGKGISLTVCLKSCKG